MSDWLDTLTPSARRAYPAIQSGVRSGLSINDIGAAIRSSGLTISNDALRQTIRLERDLVKSSGALKFLPLDRQISPQNLMESLTQIRRQYSFTVKVAEVGQSLGDKAVRRVTVTTNKILTRRQIENAARTAVTGAQERYGINIGRVQIETGMRAGSSGVL